MLIEKDIEYLLDSTSRKYKIVIVMIAALSLVSLFAGIHSIYASSIFMKILHLDFEGAISLLFTGRNFAESYSVVEVKLISLITRAMYHFLMCFVFLALARTLVSSRRRNKRILNALNESENEVSRKGNA